MECKTEILLYSFSFVKFIPVLHRKLSLMRNFLILGYQRPGLRGRVFRVFSQQPVSPVSKEHGKTKSRQLWSKKIQTFPQKYFFYLLPTTKHKKTAMDMKTLKDPFSVHFTQVLVTIHKCLCILVLYNWHIIT